VGDDLAALVGGWQQRLNGPVVLAIDQFEQLFLVYNDQERQQAIQQLASLVADRTLNLRLVILTRADFLARLQELEATLPDLLAVRFHLETLGREAAQAAVVEPTAHFGVRWEPALVQRLLDDLTNQANQGIAGPQLQLVCTALYQATLEKAQTDRLITLASYTELGGATTILGNHLAAAVAAFAPAQQPIVHLLLGALVSTRGVKQRLSLDELTRTVQVGPERAAFLLDQLTQQRLLQRYVVHTGMAQVSVEYELIHDSLTPQIVRWLGDAFWKSQQVRELLRLATAEWQLRDRLLPPDDLALAHEQLGRLVYSAQELELLYAAAVLYADRVADWSPLLDEPTRLQVLLRLLAHPEASARRQSALHLSEFASAEVATHLVQRALSDTEASVRDAAANSLAKLIERVPVHCRQVVEGLQSALLAGQHSGAATSALVSLRDQAPVCHSFLAEPQRTIILHRVWALRLQRRWPFLLEMAWQGMQGGLWGMALGFGFYTARESFHNNTEWSTMVNVIFIAGAANGFIGGAAGWAAAASGALLLSLQDYADRSRVWLVQTIAGSLLMTLTFVLFGGAWKAGLVIGLALIGVAGATGSLNKPLRLVSSGVAGIAIMLVCNWAGLLHVQIDPWFWLPWIGASAGIGFALGLEPLTELKSLTRRNSDQIGSWLPAWRASGG
jgi:hypothetical protein